MGAQARRLIMSHTVIAVAATLAVTLLAALKDLPGPDAMTVIVAVCGIGSSGAASAAQADRTRTLPRLTPQRGPREESGS